MEDVHDGLASCSFAHRDGALQVFLFSEDEFREVAGTWRGMFIGERSKGGALAIYDGWDPTLLPRQEAVRTVQQVPRYLLYPGAEASAPF